VVEEGLHSCRITCDLRLHSEKGMEQGLHTSTAFDSCALLYTFVHARLPWNQMRNQPVLGAGCWALAVLPSSCSSCRTLTLIVSCLLMTNNIAQ
jgi:hypothetical protein